MIEEKIAGYTPSAWFFRDALERAQSKREAVEIGRAAIRELELLKEWIREQGAVPPNFTVLRTEAVTKGWVEPDAAVADVIPIR